MRHHLLVYISFAIVLFTQFIYNNFSFFRFVEFVYLGCVLNGKTQCVTMWTVCAFVDVQCAHRCVNGCLFHLKLWAIFQSHLSHSPFPNAFRWLLRARVCHFQQNIWHIEIPVLPSVIFNGSSSIQAHRYHHSTHCDHFGFAVPHLDRHRCGFARHKTHISTIQQFIANRMNIHRLNFHWCVHRLQKIRPQCNITK